MTTPNREGNHPREALIQVVLYMKPTGQRSE